MAVEDLMVRDHDGLRCGPFETAVHHAYRDVNRRRPVRSVLRDQLSQSPAFTFVVAKDVDLVVTSHGAQLINRFARVALKPTQRRDVKIEPILIRTGGRAEMREVELAEAVRRRQDIPNIE